MAVNMFGIEPEVFRIFGFWASIVSLKMVAVVFMTIRHRFSKRIFMNPDDAPHMKGAKVSDDPDIARVRRCHLNDLENIPLWFIVTFLWLTTNPSAWLAGILIRTFVISRIVHTLSYAVVSKQPHRAISFMTGLAVTIFQAISTLIYYF
ncbi:microsomal glutathione S-transferase 1-like [Lasioglossum baleicum]|uniref:microsomal glutathione S-transferase 1-like n=1 Tax=Lasioglossum baleicum TaxID=434251 RepID=UPI003FCD5E5F